MNRREILCAAAALPAVALMPSILATPPPPAAGMLAAFEASSVIAARTYAAYQAFLLHQIAQALQIPDAYLRCR